MNSARCLIVSLLALLFAWPVWSAEADGLPADAWPQFKRDARRTGDHPTAELSFPLRRITAVRFPAPIYASPAVVRGRVWVQDADGHLACVDAAKNAVRWTAALGGFNNCSSPAVAHGRVYVGSTDDAFFVLDADSGAVARRIPAPGGVLAAPAVVGDAIYFSTFNGQLVKINPVGDVIWTYDGGRISITEFAASEEQIIFFAGTDNTVFHRLHDCGDRVEVIRKTPAGGAVSPQSGPVLLPGGRFAFQSFDSEYGRLCLGSQLVAGDVHDGRGVPALRGERLYRGDKCLALCLDEPDEPAQPTKPAPKEPSSAKLIPKPKPKHKLAWRADNQELYDGGSHSSPALARRVQVVGSESGYVWFHELEDVPAKRKAVWRYETSRVGRPHGAVSCSPAVVDGAVFFGGEDGILYGLGQLAQAGPQRKGDVAVRDLPIPAAASSARTAPALPGHDWPVPGGDMGCSCVAPPSTIRPPFEVAWKTRVWSTSKGPMVVADGKVFHGGRGGALTALDAATGRILWKAHHPGVESRPAPTFHQGKLLIMRTQCGQGDSPHIVGASGGPSGEGLWCHDANTGEALWRHAVPFAYHFNIDNVCACGDKVFLCETDDQNVVQAVALDMGTGRVVWRVPALGPVQKPLVRFSGAVVDGLWCVAVCRGRTWERSGVTLGLDIEHGRVVWKNEELGLDTRSRVAARKGILVVFNKEGAHALEAATGKPLWLGPSGQTNHYLQALTDRYLDSHGQDGVFRADGCHYSIYINGLWYSHDPRTYHGSNFLAAQEQREPQGKQTIVWKLGFLSNSCPAPAPAYESLYYSPNAEGVIYRFRPQLEQTAQ
jgi:outer membrane protein assembly factor BamB